MKILYFLFLSLVIKGLTGKDHISKLIILAKAGIFTYTRTGNQQKISRNHGNR